MLKMLKTNVHVQICFSGLEKIVNNNFLVPPLMATKLLKLQRAVNMPDWLLIRTGSAIRKQFAFLSQEVGDSNVNIDRVCAFVANFHVWAL